MPPVACSLPAGRVIFRRLGKGRQLLEGPCFFPVFPGLCMITNASEKLDAYRNRLDELRGFL